VKAELGEDGLPAGGGAEVAPTEAARPPYSQCRLKFLQESVSVKAEVKIEFGLDKMNVEIKSDSTRAAVHDRRWPAPTASVPPLARQP
jgi:hypothetical protein